MTDFQHIVILTGAGLSAESGLSTFRDKGGIWASVPIPQLTCHQCQVPERASESKAALES